MKSWLKGLMLVLLPYSLGCFITGIALGWSPSVEAYKWFAKRRASQALQPYIASNPVRKLQIGAGPNSLVGWLNTDIEPRRDQMYLDATAPFPIPASSFDYVFAEQLIEHLTLVQGQAMLKECHRILRAGGKIRIATPNLTTLAKLFMGKDAADRRYLQLEIQHNGFSEIPTPECAELNFQMHAFGHRFVYDPESLRTALSVAGFQNVHMTDVGVSSDPNLSGIDSHGLSTGDGFNRYIVMVVEASK